METPFAMEVARSLRLDGLALAGEGSLARDDEAAGQRVRQIGRQAVGDLGARYFSSRCPARKVVRDFPFSYAVKYRRAPAPGPKA
jgi:hypothetical protein